MPERSAVDGFALAAVLAGTVFLYAGVKGVSVLKSLQAVIQGKSPATVTPTQTISTAVDISATTAADGGGMGGPVDSSSIVSAAMGYQGHCYLYGGAPGVTGANCWDCSSFVNWVIGAVMKHSIPGAAHYDGTDHGPATGSWLTWSGATTVSAAQAQPGDLVVWATHMGIYIGNGRMISALNPSLGTEVTSVSGGAPGGEGNGTYRRLN